MTPFGCGAKNNYNSKVMSGGTGQRQMLTLSPDKSVEVGDAMKQHEKFLSARAKLKMM
jgi:hypothetical protein